MYCHKLYETLLKEPAVCDTTRKRRTVSACVVFTECNLTLCSQAWLAAVSWLDDEIRPAAAQMVWFLLKKNCHSAFYRLKYFNKDSVYFNTFWTLLSVVD